MAEEKTPLDIQNLKNQWLNDPNWEIEATPGFEAYYDELLAWSHQQKRKWMERARLDLENFAKTWGIPDHIELAKWMRFQAERIAHLEEEIDKLKNGE